jgi:hypothetical protein
MGNPHEDFMESIRKKAQKQQAQQQTYQEAQRQQQNQRAYQSSPFQGNGQGFGQKTKATVVKISSTVYQIIF